MKFPQIATSLLGATGRISEKCSPYSPDYCAGTAFNGSLAHLYVCGDSRLGPVTLPTRIPLISLTSIYGYDRFGGLCPGPFLAAWTSATTGWWIYPPNSGLSLDTEADPIFGDMVLAPGVLVDRFGGERGGYVSPVFAPYSQRALPPSNLVTPPDDPAFPYNYHVYRVIREIEVAAGLIVPWFGQPGQGVQYQLPNGSNVMMLVESGHLQPVDPSTLLKD